MSLHRAAVDYSEGSAHVVPSDVQRAIFVQVGFHFGEGALAVEGAETIACRCAARRADDFERFHGVVSYSDVDAVKDEVLVQYPFVGGGAG